MASRVSNYYYASITQSELDAIYREQFWIKRYKNFLFLDSPHWKRRTNASLDLFINHPKWTCRAVYNKQYQWTRSCSVLRYQKNIWFSIQDLTRNFFLGYPIFNFSAHSSSVMNYAMNYSKRVLSLFVASQFYSLICLNTPPS